MLLDMLFAVEPKARVFAIDTHYLFPETYELWREVERRYDTKVEVFEGPSRRGAHGDPRREALGAQARPLPRGRQGRAAGPRARRPRLLDHRHPPRPVADARERAEARLGRRARALEGEPARRLERRRLLDVHPRARAALQRAARPRLRIRSATPTRRSPAPAARAAGPAATGPSAACTHRDPGAGPPLPPRRARGGGDPHHARGRRRARAAGAALLGRQGLDRAAPARREGVPARRVPVPGHARRHGPQLPRGDRVPRPPRRRARRDADRRVGAGVDRPRPRRRGDRPARLAQPAADDDAARRDRGARLRRRDRRRAPRRGARPREGADLQLPRRLRPVEPARAAARALEPLQRARPPAASTCASSRSRTGPSSTSGSTSPARASSCRRSTSPTSARCSAATGCSTRRASSSSAMDGEEPFTVYGPLPHRRRHVAAPARSLSEARTLEEVVAEIAATRVTERGETRADDRFSEAAMEDRKRVGYF